MYTHVHTHTHTRTVHVHMRAHTHTHTNTDTHTYTHTPTHTHRRKRGREWETDCVWVLESTVVKMISPYQNHPTHYYTEAMVAALVTIYTIISRVDTGLSKVETAFENI